jgi:hypothetical protein
MRILRFNSDVSDQIGLIVPSNAPPSSIVKLEFRLSKMPPTTVLSMLNQYPKLQEFAWEYTEAGPVSRNYPFDFILGLRPIQATLVKLNLSIYFEDWAEPGRLNLSQFRSLKVLQIHERLILWYNFDYDYENEMNFGGQRDIEDDRLGLYGRLPATLEHLEVSLVLQQQQPYFDFISTNLLQRSYSSSSLVSLGNFALQKPITIGLLLWHATKL